MGNRYAWWFIGSVITVPVLAFLIVSWYQERYAVLPVFGEPGHTVQPFSCTNQRNETITLQDWNNKIVVANFFFTSCPSICPKMTANLKKVLEHFPGDNGIQVSSFTVDPERDDPARLSGYAKRYGVIGRWDFLTGSKKEIYRLARNSMLVVATDGDGGENDFIHSEKLVLVDKKARIRGFYDGTSESAVDLLIKDIKKLKNSD